MIINQQLFKTFIIRKPNDIKMQYLIHFNIQQQQTAVMHELNSQQFTRSFSHLSKDALVVILQDSLKQQQFLKLQLLVHQQQLFDCQQQLEILKTKTSTENDTCLMLMYTQQRNVDKIDRLQKAINNFQFKHKENIPMRNKQSQWECKYKELERHLDLYIGNSNKVQEELLEGCRKMKRENAKVYKQYQKEAYFAEESRLRCNGLQMTLVQRETEIERINEDLEDKKKQVQNLKNQLEKQRRQIRLMTERQQQNKRDKQNQRREQSEKEQYMLIRQYKQSTERYSKLQEQLRSLEFRYSGLSKQRDILHNQITDIKQKSEQHKHQNYILKQTISKLEEYNKGLLERLIEPPTISVSGSVTQRGIVETWSVEVKRLKKQLEDLDRKYQALKDENKRMVNDKMLLDEKVRVIEATNQQLLKQNLLLSSQLRLEKSKEDITMNCRTNSMLKHEDTEGQSTIITSLEMNWTENYARKPHNFLSHDFAQQK